VPKSTTVPLPALPVLENPRVFPYPCPTLPFGQEEFLGSVNISFDSSKATTLFIQNEFPGNVPVDTSNQPDVGLFPATTSEFNSHTIESSMNASYQPGFRLPAAALNLPVSGSRSVHSSEYQYHGTRRPRSEPDVRGTQSEYVRGSRSERGPQSERSTRSERRRGSRSKRGSDSLSMLQIDKMATWQREEFHRQYTSIRNACLRGLRFGMKGFRAVNDIHVLVFLEGVQGSHPDPGRDCELALFCAARISINLKPVVFPRSYAPKLCSLVKATISSHRTVDLKKVAPLIKRCLGLTAKASRSDIAAALSHLRATGFNKLGGFIHVYDEFVSHECRVCGRC
jgi:hypothetical protein